MLPSLIQMKYKKPKRVKIVGLAVSGFLFLFFLNLGMSKKEMEDPAQKDTWSLNCSPNIVVLVKFTSHFVSCKKPKQIICFI